MRLRDGLIILCQSSLAGPFGRLHGSKVALRIACPVPGHAAGTSATGCNRLGWASAENVYKVSSWNINVTHPVEGYFLKGIWSRKSKINRKAKNKKETSVKFYICSRPLWATAQTPQESALLLLLDREVRILGHPPQYSPSCACPLLI